LKKHWKILEIKSPDPKAKLAAGSLAREKDIIKPYIIRKSSKRIEILVSYQKYQRAVKTLEKSGLEVVARDPLSHEDCRGKDFVKELVEEERFYEAHICSEALERESRQIGECLALYTALLVKISENSRVGVADLHRKLQAKNCKTLLDYDCIRNLIRNYFNSGLLHGAKARGCIKI